jgi:2,2-dialkylglycine decarboxylase (pyruvate)
MFAFERDRVVPDILTLSKTLGAGLPLSAVMTTDALAAEAEDREFLFYTTHVNDPLPAAVGLKVLEIVRRDDLAAKAKAAGARLAAGLRRLQQRHACVGDVRGRGLLLGLEFTAAGGQPAAAISDAVTDVALELGLSANIVRAGASGGTMRIAPPLTVTDAEIDLGVELLEAAIARVVPAPQALRRPPIHSNASEQGQAAG